MISPHTLNPDEMVYLASPYSHPSKAVESKRHRAVVRAAAHFSRQGVLIYSPIAHGHFIARVGNLPTSYEYWRKHDEFVISMCSQLWALCLDGFMASVGVAGEMEFAMKRGIPVHLVDPVTYELRRIAS